LTISDIFYFVNQAMERDVVLKSEHYTLVESKDFWIKHKDFDIICNYTDKKIIVQNRKNNVTKLDVTDMDIAQFKVLWEKVKQYSENMLCNKFLKYFTSEDNTIKTIDQIDD